MLKYIVLPDWIVSRNDFERHWISAPELMALYGVHPTECVVLTGIQREAYEDDPGFLSSLTALRPRYDGNYSL